MSTPGAADACASLSGNGASCAQADTQTLQTIEDQIRRRGASSAAAARACHVCARARVCLLEYSFQHCLQYLSYLFCFSRYVSRYVFACLRFGCLCLERSFENLVCSFECSEFDVIVYSELYRSNGHHQPWLWQVPATLLQRACHAHCGSRRDRAASTGDRRRRF